MLGEQYVEYAGGNTWNTLVVCLGSNTLNTLLESCGGKTLNAMMFSGLVWMQGKRCRLRLNVLLSCGGNTLHALVFCRFGTRVAGRPPAAGRPSDRPPARVSRVRIRPDTPGYV